VQEDRAFRPESTSHTCSRGFLLYWEPQGAATHVTKQRLRQRARLPQRFTWYELVHHGQVTCSVSYLISPTMPRNLSFTAHGQHVVTCLLFDSDKILTGSDDGEIHVHDTETGALRTRLKDHTRAVWAMQYEGDTLVSGSTDQSVRVWDIPSGKCLHVLLGHTNTVRRLIILKAASPTGAAGLSSHEPLFITASRDATCRVWKLPRSSDEKLSTPSPPTLERPDPYFLRAMMGHENTIRDIAAHADVLITGSYDYTVGVWQISTGNMLHRLRGHTQKVYSVALDYDRGHCISGSMDCSVKIWSVATGTCLFTLPGHYSLVSFVRPGHGHLVSASVDGRLRIWDLDYGAARSILFQHSGSVTCFQHDDLKVISGANRTLTRWDISTGECRELLTDLDGVWQVQFDSERWVAAVQRNGVTYIEVQAL